MFSNKIKLLFSLIVLLIAGLVGYKFYSYFSYDKAPSITFSGITPEGCCRSVVSCEAKCDSGYSIGAIDLAVDNNKIDIKEKKKLGKKSSLVLFDLDTTLLNDGKHTISVEAADRSYKNNKSNLNLNFYVDNVPLKAAFLQSEYKVSQGHTLHLKINANKRLDRAQIKFLSQIYNCYPESNFSTIYECFIPIGCEDSSGDHLLIAELYDAPGNEVKLSSNVKIESFVFPKQKGFRVSQEKLEEDRDVGISDKVMEEALVKWLKDSPKEKLWTGAFELPINVKRMATPFGEIRMTPEKGRYLHRAVDLIDLPKSVVWASENGKVIIKDRFFMSGNTVVLDHGLGVISMYFHLEDFADIEIGDFVKKGNPLGRLGETGYATGYHLHWEIRVNNVAINPLQWTEKNF